MKLEVPAMKEPLLDQLNPAQKEAVIWGHSPLLVLAGAGSGKTRILTRRIAWLIAGGVRASNVLAVTFTNKAAGEMRSRVQKLVNQDVWVSTFHSTCLKILRMDGQAIGIDRHFSVYDDGDQMTLVKECLRELNMNEKQVHPKGVRERIQRAKDLLTTPYQYAEKAPDLFEEAVAKVYGLYEKRLEQLKACDFGDLIMKAVLLFDRHPAVLAAWQDRFRHILIDEYQDTNRAQYRFVRLLAEKHRQITVVGDPDQSIYAWRGADIRNILNFEKDYPECGIIRMEQNYRSSSVILTAANELIRRNTMRKHKELWTEREGGPRISLFEAHNEKEEAEYVVGRILQYRRDGKTLADQVIFYRVHAQSRVLEDVLRRMKVPYKIIGGVRFYDRKEIKDLIAYLKASAFPHDDLSLKRILNVPARGIGKKALESIESYAAARGCPLREALRHPADLEGASPRLQKTLAALDRMLGSFHAAQKNLKVSEILRDILERTRYVAELQAEKSIEAQTRLENIEEFFTVIQDFEETYRPEDEISPLESFLESVTLVTDLDTWDQGTDILTMMTLHTAKGLEFPVVYMVGLEEGIFPNVKAYSEDIEDLEEERRLCYVGITRTKEKLHLSYASERHLYGSWQHNLPSRFLHEIPQELFDTSMDSFPDDDFDDPLIDDEIDVD
ncbi:MAG: UvrD-helicase domain-containing protein [Candidatus Omnitrophota bacterium]|jgi:DNA helicase-2/ATP-dependent DNA helicase PcrA